MPAPINFLAVIVATIASIIVGFVWYGPLFGKPWMKLMGMSLDSMSKEKQKGMQKTYVIMTFTTLIMAYVMAHATEFGMSYTKIYGVMGGLMAGFWNWLGFVMPIQIGEQLWGGKSWKLFLINGGHTLSMLLLMGVILAVWR